MNGKKIADMLEKKINQNAQGKKVSGGHTHPPAPRPPHLVVNADHAFFDFVKHLRQLICADAIFACVAVALTQVPIAKLFAKVYTL